MYAPASPLLVGVAVLCAVLAVAVFYTARRRELAARRELSVRHRRELGSFAAMVDKRYGTERVPAPGTVTLYCLYPFFTHPDGGALAPAVPHDCPLPEHVLRVVQVTDPSLLESYLAQGGVFFGPRRRSIPSGRRQWSATCQLCGAHYTQADDRPPPPEVAELIRIELARARG